MSVKVLPFFLLLLLAAKGKGVSGGRGPQGTRQARGIKATQAGSPVAASGAVAGLCGGGRWGTAGPPPGCSAGAGTQS